MKKTNKKRIKVPAAANGMKSGIDPTRLISAVPGTVDVLTGMFLQSNATTGGLAAMQSVMDIGKGVATGALAGMAFGPLGAAIGGGAGLIAGAIGKKGRGASMQSFTDYDEGTLNTGLRGLFGSNKKLRKRRSAIRQNAFGNRAAVEGTAALLEDYLDIAEDLDENTFENGGMSPQSLAYVDDGELIQTPDGSISAIPEQGQPTDSNLVSLPEGSKVLSDTLKVPGTKKTFAEVGKEMMSNKKIKGKDRFAENSAKLNQMNNSMIHNELFNLQETLKNLQGIKPRTKSIDAERFDEGGTIKFNPNASAQYRNKKYKLGLTVDLNGVLYEVINTPGMLDNIYTLLKMAAASPSVNTVNQPVSAPSSTPSKETHTTTKKAPATRAVNTTTPISTQFSRDLEMPELNIAKLNLSNLTKGTDLNSMHMPEVGSIKPSGDLYREPKKSGTKWYGYLGDVGSMLGELTPSITNLFAKPGEYSNLRSNIYEPAILNTMRRRRFDIEPARREILQNTSTTNYNADQLNTNTGANMAFRLANATAANRAIQGLYSQKNNVENQYRGEYAEMMNNLGSQYRETQRYNEDTNRRINATADNIRMKGLEGISAYLQNNRRERNQRRADQTMLPMYLEFLKNSFTDDVLSGLTQQARNIRKKGAR